MSHDCPSLLRQVDALLNFSRIRNRTVHFQQLRHLRALSERARRESSFSDTGNWRGFRRLRLGPESSTMNISCPSFPTLSPRAEIGEILREAFRDDRRDQPPDTEIDREALRLHIEEWTSSLDFLISQRLAVAWSNESDATECVDTEEIALRRQLDDLIRLEADVQDLKTSQTLVLEIEADERVATRDHAIAMALDQARTEDSDELNDIVDWMGDGGNPSHEEVCSFRIHGSSSNTQPKHRATSKGTLKKRELLFPTSAAVATTHAPLAQQVPHQGPSATPSVLGGGKLPEHEPSDTAGGKLPDHEPKILVGAIADVPLPQEEPGVLASVAADSNQAQQEGPGALASVTADSNLAQQTSCVQGGATTDTIPQQQVTKDMLSCIICFDEFSLRDILSAGDMDGPSSSSTMPGCGHHTCRDCMRQYVRTQLSERKYPLMCPAASCSSAIGDKVVECSALLLNSEDYARDRPSECLECNCLFFPTCRITAWHKGLTCDEFGQLPTHQRSSEEAEVLNMAKEMLWKQCPACKLYIERTVGCNHMRCRCGVEFGYRCGGKDTKKADTRGRNPGCKCDLFDVPAEGEEHAAPAAAAPAPPAAPAPQRYYNRRDCVPASIACRRAASIYACGRASIAGLATSIQDCVPASIACRRAASIYACVRASIAGLATSIQDCVPASIAFRRAASIYACVRASIARLATSI
eukprot:gene25231-10877_t